MKVLTYKGFKSFDDILDQGVQDILKIYFTDGSNIKCTFDHKFLVDTYAGKEWIEAGSLFEGLCLSGKIIEKIEECGKSNVYDLFNVEETHSYTTNGIESHNCNFLYIDEASFIPNNVAEDFFTATYPTISSGKTTKILITSTPMGYNHFWKFWNEAIHGINGFIPARVHWYEVPGRDEEWRNEQLKILGQLKYSQEVECSFLGSSSTLISGEVLSQLSPIPPIYIKENFEVLEPPVPENFYSIVCDTARGVGGDYSAFTIIDCTKYPYRVVAKFRDNNISPLLFPTIIHKVAKDYNDAHVLIEINDIGQQVADILYDELEYENVIHIDSMQKKGQFVSFSNTDAKRGIRTTKQVKSIGCAVLKSLVEEKKLLIFDSDIISELTTFVETKGSYEADEGYHDDLAMCLVLFAWLTSDPIFKDLTNTNNRKALYDKRMDNIMSGLTPFGILPDSKKQFEIEVIGDDVWFTDKHENDLENFIHSMID